MGDNGFAFGEHGLIDKRTAYEESMRVPMLMHVPGAVPRPAQPIDRVVANIDIAPTMLDRPRASTPPAHMQGTNMLPLAQGQDVPWRDDAALRVLLGVELPQTPTLFALRGDQYKFIRYYGVWDVDVLFDLRADPLEMDNLAYRPEFTAIARQMSDRLFAVLEETDGRFIPLYPDRFLLFNKRTPAPGAEQAAPFPPALILKPGERPY